MALIPDNPMNGSEFVLDRMMHETLRDIMSQPFTRSVLETCFKQYVERRMLTACLNIYPELHTAHHAHIMAAEALWNALELTAGVKELPPQVPRPPTI